MGSLKSVVDRPFRGRFSARARGPLHCWAVPYPLANALYQWEEGARELRAIDDPRQRRQADRVVDAIRLELRRRIGPTFSAEELADLYGEGTDWAQQIALDVAPAVEGDAQALADAAFWAYLRNARNFAGGRSLA
jgi:hypothetical protein